MSINNIGIEDGYYGTYHLDKDGNEIFTKSGKEIIIKDIQHDLDTGNITLILRFDYLGEYKTVPISRDVFTEPKLVSILTNAGADISRKTYDTAIDSLRLQESELGIHNYIPINIYNNLGWIKLNTLQGTKACFRSYKLLGETGTYTGDYKITPMGSYDEWRQMVLNDIIGDTTFELILIAALSSIIVPLVTPINDPGNPILHLFGISGCGKSTGLDLAASIGGEPFEGDKIVTLPDGTFKTLHSLYRSWGGTVNALIGSCGGNNGYPILLNELGKCQANDLSTLVYNFSEGTDKLRYSKDMKTTQSQGYSTSFISTGEHSLLDRCKDKSDGLRVRVLEVEMTKTPEGAERADRIKATCKKHNGHAIPKMAQYILTILGFSRVQEMYQKNYDECLMVWDETPSYERFIAKFVALYLTTADVAIKALDIPFNKEDIRYFLYEYDKKNGSQRNTSLSSYDILIEEFNINRHKFIVGDTIPKAECWGKITKENRKVSDTKYIVERFLVYKEPVNELLKKHGFQNPSTCFKEWKKAGLIDADKDKNTRSRKIHPASTKTDDVFVFNIFQDTPTPLSKPTKSILHLLKEDIA